MLIYRNAEGVHNRENLGTPDVQGSHGILKSM